nr:hypothetical protein B0A51_04847 [Rachicladosporium sp. CCFEE 5018]
MAPAVLIDDTSAISQQSTMPSRFLSDDHFPPTPASVPDSPRQKAANGRTASKTFGEHLAWVIEHDHVLQRCIDAKAETAMTEDVIVLSGEHLTLAELVAVAWYNVPVTVSSDSKVRNRVNTGIEFLQQHLETGNVVYGINTGYGGSADTRSNDFANMQRALIQHQESGVLLPSDLGRFDNVSSANLQSLKPHNLPRYVVRGSMVARVNSLLRGHSAVRLEIVEAITTLLNHDFIPVIPLRGSISASGDLSPLSYIAGALEGNSDIHLDCAIDGGRRQIMSADNALRMAGLQPTTMRPKEGLGLMNGTGVSCAAGTMALHETQYLALASQVLTAMSTEAMRGSADNYHPFISDVRPHPGQREVAENIFRQLRKSRLVVGKDAHTAGLYQDRYALRTAPQWLGPQLEDLSLAASQVAIELNSTTDNPLVDAENGYVHHGGNFQAASITSAMEKARLSLQMMGKLMFAQNTELINTTLNGILTPNLAFDDPGLSYTFKGIDINMAAYQSELAYLANPVSSHVQSAEMHNQAVNSLALISSRYTMDTVELVSLMTATHLYTVCQALDLHVLNLEYMELIEQEAEALFLEKFPDLASTWPEVLVAIKAGLLSAKSKDTASRAAAAAEASLIPITLALPRNGSMPLSTLDSWTSDLTAVITSAIRQTRIRFASPEGPPTLQYLGYGSAIMYSYIRHDLGVPLHKGLVEHPTYPSSEREGVQVQGEKVTIGTRIGRIYEALRSGGMRGVLIKSLS